MNTVEIILIFCVISLILWLMYTWSQVSSIGQQLNTKEQTDGNKLLKILYQELENISTETDRQYSHFREEMAELLEFLEVMFCEFTNVGEKEVKQKLFDYKEKITVRLRKMELTSNSVEVQQGALYFFAGSHYGKSKDIVQYIQTLYNNENIHKENNKLALLIMRNVNY